MKFLGYFNMIGVLALAALCVGQWVINRRVNLEAVALDKTRQEQAARIADQVQAIAGYKSDLDHFRKRLEESEAAIKEAEARIVKVSSERDQAAAERDADAAARDRANSEVADLKTTLEKWVAAVKLRDDVLKKDKEEVEKAIQGRDQAVSKFNDLAGKYNGLVKDLNEARAKPAAK